MPDREVGKWFYTPKEESHDEFRLWQVCQNEDKTIYYHHAGNIYGLASVDFIVERLNMKVEID